MAWASGGPLEFVLKLVTWTMAPVYDDACCANDVS